MRKTTTDTVLRVRLKHRPGQLAKLATALAEQGALLGDIRTLRIGEEDTLREVTVEADGEEATERVIAAVRALEGVELLGVTDQGVRAAQGGSFTRRACVKLEQNSDLRYIYTPGVARVSKAIAGTPRLRGSSRPSVIPSASSRMARGFSASDRSGPLASMPVMEGKAVPTTLRSISATPILVDTTDPSNSSRRRANLDPSARSTSRHSDP